MRLLFFAQLLKCSNGWNFWKRDPHATSPGRWGCAQNTVNISSASRQEHAKHIKHCIRELQPWIKQIVLCRACPSMYASSDHYAHTHTHSDTRDHGIQAQILWFYASWQQTNKLIRAIHVTSMQPAVRSMSSLRFSLMPAVAVWP